MGVTAANIADGDHALYSSMLDQEFGVDVPVMNYRDKLVLVAVKGKPELGKYVYMAAYGTNLIHQYTLGRCHC